MQPKISSPIYYLDKDGSNLSDRSRAKRKTLKEIQNELKKQIVALENFDQHQFSIESQQPVFIDMESSILNAIWGSKSVKHVKNTIDDVVQSAKYIIGQVSQQLDESGPLDEYELLGPNIASAALRRILDLKPNFQENIIESDVHLAQEMVPRLLNVVGRQILTREGGEASTLSSIHSNDHIYSFSGFMSSLSQWLGISPSSIFRYEITSTSKANYLCSLGKIELMQRRSTDTHEKSRLAGIAKQVCRQTLCGDYGKLFVQEVKPVLLLETLTSLATFDFRDETNILHMIGDRLHQGDATGQLNGRQLSQGLWAFAVLDQPHLLLLKSFTRRLRKSPVRKSLTTSDITRAIWSAGRSLQHHDLITQNQVTNKSANKNDQSNVSDEEIGSIREEIVVMIYTLSNELLEHNINTGIHRLNNLSTRQVADLLHALSIAEFDSEVHPIVNAISKQISDGRLLQTQVSTTDLARILWSFHRLKLDRPDATVEALVQKIIENHESSHTTLTPKTLNTILRSVVFLLPDHGKSLQKLHGICSKNILNKSFLKSCNEFECSNFLFYLAMANLYDKESIKKLADRMKDDDTIKSCTPSSASRFLWSFTKLVESNVEDIHMKEILFEMFRDLGGILLSMQLTPVDASSAMWAIAKSSYSLDMGIFDHLAEFLTQQCMMKAATIQQVTEALWACGKIYKWDWEGREMGKATSPPYIRSAKTFASFLVSHRSKMTPKDISQSILSVGYLQICDENIVKPFAYKAIEFADEAKFNSQELANIVWALSKVNFEDKVVFSHLTTQLCTKSIMEQCTPQEAANVLYALGKMKIRDKNTFECMTAVLMKNLDGATTQAIANALWAHECVNLTPDRQFFDSWAHEKLNIVGLYLENQNDNVL